ncbi:MAG: hypothetical protein U0169_05430 [Polyangiaceae bacterium]
MGPSSYRDHALARGSTWYAPPAMCPHCGQNAPVVYRGFAAYCSACGKTRMPLAAQSITMAGQPSKVGGSVARVFGWLVLAGGLSFAIVVALLAQWLWPAGIVGYILGIPSAIFTLFLATMLLKGGGKLKEVGEEASRSAHRQALFALAEHKGGILTARDVAAALDMPLPDADRMLTHLATHEADHVVLDVDDQGALSYRFPALLRSGSPVHGAASGAPGVRVAAPGTPEAVARDRRTDAELQAEAEAEVEALMDPSRRGQKRV